MKIKVYGKNYGKICYVYIENGNFEASKIKDLINIFDSKYIMASIVALTRDSKFVDMVKCKESYNEIIFPQENTITAETTIITDKQKVESLLERLLNCDSRCITIYGTFSSLDSASSLILDKCTNYQNKWIVNNVVEYEISVVLEENLTIVSFNRLGIDENNIIDHVKKIFCSK